MRRQRVVKTEEQRRRDLMDAARDLFVRQGYEATAVQDIARQAGAAAGTFYIYFPSKQDVLRAIMGELLQELGGIIRAVAGRPDLGAVAKLRAAWDETLAHIGQESRLIEAIYLKANVSLPLQLLEECNPVPPAVLATIIEQGNAEGSLQVAHPAAAADFLWAIGYRLFERVAQERMGPAPAAGDLETVQEAFWELVLRGFGARA